VTVAVAGCGTAGQASIASREVDTTCYQDPSADAPRYVPPGYHFVRRWEGADSGNFPADSRQLTWEYLTACTQDAWTYPLLVSWVPSVGTTVTATEHHPGRSVDLGIAGVTAVYQDGWWGVGATSWDSSAVNSITVNWSGGTYGIRGAKTRGVDLERLIKIARSMHYAAS
jgi:hypothetical protein